MPRPKTYCTECTVTELLHDSAGEGAAQQGYAFFGDDGEETVLSYRDRDYKYCVIAASLRSNVNFGQRLLLLYPPGREFVSGNVLQSLYRGAQQRAHR
jgi:hypothetical protein